MVNEIVVNDSSSVDKQSQNSSKSIFSRISLTKLLTKKNLKIAILTLIAVFGMIIYFGINTEDEVVETSKILTTGTYRTTMEYCAELESKLQSVLSSIQGAGEVNVMISLDGSPELIYAKDVDEKVSSNSSGTTTSSTSSSPIIVNSNALILTENLPQVKGVIIVSSGAGNIGVKLDILNAVSTLLDISTDKISVLQGI